MIVRISRATVRPEGDGEAFDIMRSIVTYAPREVEGLAMMHVGRRFHGSVEQVVVITVWRDFDALTAAMGPDWSHSAFPAAFAGRVSDVTVEHYETLDPDAETGAGVMHIPDPLTASLPAGEPTVRS